MVFEALGALPDVDGDLEIGSGHGFHDLGVVGCSFEQHFGCVEVVDVVEDPVLDHGFETGWGAYIGHPVRGVDHCTFIFG